MLLIDRSTFDQSTPYRSRKNSCLHLFLSSVIALLPSARLEYRLSTRVCTTRKGYEKYTRLKALPVRHVCGLSYLLYTSESAKPSRASVPACYDLFLWLESL